MNNKRLFRSRTDKKIFGVCGGIGEYLGIDSTIIRLVAVILIFTGYGIPVYLIAALVIPETVIYDDPYRTNSGRGYDAKRPYGDRPEDQTSDQGAPSGPDEGNNA